MTDSKKFYEKVPFGILGLKAERIIHSNQFMRDALAMVPKNLSDIADRYPEFESLRDVQGSRLPLWLTLNKQVYCVITAGTDAEIEHYFIPSQFLTNVSQPVKILSDKLNDFVEIFENCFDGIYVADGAGRSLWMNAGFERCYGIHAAEFLGTDVKKLTEKGFIDPLITWKVIETKSSQTALQKTKSGKSILATGVPLLAQDGSVRRVIINSRDMTELTETKGKLDAAKREILHYERELLQAQRHSGSYGEFLWFDDAVGEVVALGLRVAQTEAAITITGEPGVGKLALADLLFRNSRRERKRLRKICFGNLSDATLLQELFGTTNKDHISSDIGILVQARGGTLILEQVDKMSPQVQQRLAEWFRSEQTRNRGKSLAVRLIITSQKDLLQMVQEGSFREDLYHIFTVLELSLPPLRERFSDIAGLAQHFLGEFNAKHKTEKYFARTALARLVRWHWPGNVRELRKFIERFVIVENAHKISDKAVRISLASSPMLPTNSKTAVLSNSETSFQNLVRFYEADLLINYIERSGSIAKAARDTGISASTIKRKLAWKRSQEPIGIKQKI
ncbi:MAG: sigma 54-interacting transcriptional regulator [Paracoccaceae bacterium]